MDAASVNTPEILGDLKYQGWNLQEVLSAGYVSERLMQRMVWMAKCSHSAHMQNGHHLQVAQLLSRDF